MPHPLAIADSNCSIKAHRYFRRMKNLPLKIHVRTISLFYLSVTSKKVSGYIEEDTIRYGQDTVLPSKNRVHVHNSLRTIKQFTLNHTVSLFPPYVTVLTQIVLSSTFIPRYVVAAAAAHKEIRAISVLTRGFREKRFIPTHNCSNERASSCGCDFFSYEVSRICCVAING